jgi:ribosomal protein L37AE/L43A
MRLTSDWIRSGIVMCPDCGRTFEATAFTPLTRRLRVVEVMATVDGANACANHARNAAVTTCQRCGLFICSLCDMNVGSGSYCPSCFERLRSGNELKGTSTRYRDYATMARNTMLAGIFFSFFGFLFGPLSLYYARKGLKQLQSEGRSTLGLRVVSIFAILELLAGVGFIVFVIMGIAGAWD